MVDTDLHQDFGELKGRFESLEKSVERLTDRVEELTDALNQVRGAKFIAVGFFMVLSAISGALAAIGIKFTGG